MRSLLFWGCFPFVLPQALRVRKTAPRFSAASGPRKGCVGTGRSLTLIGIGDSIIAGVGASRSTNALAGQTALELATVLQAEIRWTAHGSIGANSDRVLLDVVPTLPAAAADFILVSVGVNDVTGLSRVSQWKKNLRELLNTLRQHSPAALIAVAGIPPMQHFPLLPQPLRTLAGIRGETLDSAAQTVIAEHAAAIYVPVELDAEPEKFSADGYHPSDLGYQEFARLMAQRIAARYHDAAPESA